MADTHATRVLAAIEAVLERRATKDQESYTIDGRSLSRTPISELLLLRNLYRREVQLEAQAENVAAGKANGRMILTRFS